MTAPATSRLRTVHCSPINTVCVSGECRESLMRLFPYADGLDALQAAFDAAKNPTTPTCVIASLLSTTQGALYNRLLQNPNCSVNDLGKNTTAYSPLTRAAVAKNPACPAHLLVTLAADSDSRVNYAAIMNPSCPDEAWMVYLKRANQQQRRHLIDSGKPPEWVQNFLSLTE